MSSEFVRYAPEIETIDPNIDELLARIIDFWPKKGRESPRAEGTGRAVARRARKGIRPRAQERIRYSSAIRRSTTCSSRRSATTCTTTWRAARQASTSS